MKEKTRVVRYLTLLFLWTLAWVFAMFVVDDIWGDKAAQWLSVIFVVVNGFVIAMFTVALASRARSTD